MNTSSTILPDDAHSFPPSKDMPVPALELPRLTLRVGLIGNRTSASGVALDSPGVLKAVRQVFDAIGSEVLGVWKSGHCYQQEKPTIRFVSGMASGADQILVQQAFSESEERFERELFIIYPYNAADYSQVNPRRAGLPAKEDWSINLDADHPSDPDPANPNSPGNAPARRSRQRAYQAQAWFIRQHSDILVAIWDPANEFKLGGTEDSIRLALRQGLPVIWIHPGEPECVRILREPDESNPAQCDSGRWKGELKKVVHQLLNFPRSRQRTKSEPGHAGGDPLAEFREFFEPPPSGDTWRRSIWEAGLAILLGMFNLQRGLMAWFKESSGQPQPSPAGRKRKSSPEAPGLQPYARYKTQADALAGHYAGMYRGGFMLNHLLGWLAVLCAALGLFVIAGQAADGSAIPGIVLAAAELTAIGGILWNVHVARVECWHEKSINYRYLAELFRQMDFLAPLGCATPSSRPPLQYATHDPRQSWMAWLFHALIRQAPPLITGSDTTTHHHLDAPHNQRVLMAVADNWLRGQIDHHRKNAERMSRLHQAIEFWSKVFFYFVLGCVAIHFAIDGSSLAFHSHVGHEFVRACLVVGTVLPAAVITLVGFRNQAESRRLAERSWSMALQLAKLRREVRRLRRNKDARPGCFTWEVATAIQAVGQVMVDEVTDWQIVYRMHEISEA